MASVKTLLAVLLIIGWSEGRMKNILIDPYIEKKYTNQSQLVTLLSHRKCAYFKGERVKEVVLEVDRKYYVNVTPYKTMAIRVGHGATFSPLQMQVVGLEKLKDQLKPGNKALDVGCGTGYVTTCMALMVGSNGSVTGVEHIHELVEEATAIGRQRYPTMLEEGRLRFVEGDGRFGLPNQTFDAINVGAVATEVPESLIQQLNNGGRLVMPINNMITLRMPNQELLIVDKHMNGTITEEVINGRFIVTRTELLTDKESQLNTAAAEATERNF